MNLGIFESLAADQHDIRLASRRALVLSRDRIDQRLGRFLGASRSQAEFDARYSLVGEDFAGIVHVACDEVGHGDPWSVVKTLHDHYRTAGNGDVGSPEEDLEEDLEMPEEAGSEGEDEIGPKPKKSKKEKKKAKKNKKKNKGKPPWLKDDDDSDDDGGDSDHDDDDELSFAASAADAVPLASKTAVDDGDSSSKETEDLSGKEGDGNTGLSGPSPKMDKARWTPKSVKPIDVPSKRHPTVQKDVIKVIPKENEGPPGDASKIDEANSLTEKETLPTGKGLDDAGFAGNNMPSGPHTDQWGKGDQTEPVKSDSLED